jgi:hypothetical protein
MSDIPISPDQLQWVLDHNRQIRGGHRVRIADAVEGWRRDRAQRDALLAAARLALEEMRHTVAPRNSFTDAVDALDRAITAAVEVIR